VQTGVSIKKACNNLRPWGLIIKWNIKHHAMIKKIFHSFILFCSLTSHAPVDTSVGGGQPGGKIKTTSNVLQQNVNIY
jgi:hypothetical protein